MYYQLKQELWISFYVKTYKRCPRATAGKTARQIYVINYKLDVYKLIEDKVRL